MKVPLWSWLGSLFAFPWAGAQAPVGALAPVDERQGDRGAGPWTTRRRRRRRAGAGRVRFEVSGRRPAGAVRVPFARRLSSASGGAPRVFFAVETRNAASVDEMSCSSHEAFPHGDTWS